MFVHWIREIRWANIYAYIYCESLHYIYRNGVWKKCKSLLVRQFGQIGRCEFSLLALRSRNGRCYRSLFKSRKRFVSVEFDEDVRTNKVRVCYLVDTCVHLIMWWLNLYLFQLHSNTDRISVSIDYSSPTLYRIIEIYQMHTYWRWTNCSKLTMIELNCGYLAWILEDTVL